MRSDATHFYESDSSVTIFLTISNATGALFLHDRGESSGTNSVVLCGNLIFSPTYMAPHGALQLLCTATLLDARGSNPIYELAVAGGLRGSMIAIGEKQDESDPDYRGHLGVNGELSVSGWNRNVDGVPYIAINVGICLEKLATAAVSEVR